MLILTLDTIPDTAFDVLGIVHGNTCSAKMWAATSCLALKTLWAAKCSPIPP